VGELTWGITRWHKSEIISRYRDGIDDIYDEINKRYEFFYELYLKEFERVYIIPLNECQDRVLKCSERMTIEDLYECINLLNYQNYYKRILMSCQHLFLSYGFFRAKVSQRELLDEDKVKNLVDQQENQHRLEYLNELLKKYE
jgi:hypothetical protein